MVDGVHPQGKLEKAGTLSPIEKPKQVTSRKVLPRAERLNRTVVVRAAIHMADRDGIHVLSMRRLSEELGVVPMALYKHVHDKDALLNAMVDAVVEEIGVITAPITKRWQPAVRSRVLQARATLIKHSWAREVIETRTSRTPVVLEYLDSIARLFLAGGLSADLTHHVMHALGSRVWGFTQDVFDQRTQNAAPMDPATLHELARRFPGLASVAAAVGHDRDSVVGRGCDDQFEFEFALDLLLDGIARLHAKHWSSH